MMDLFDDVVGASVLVHGSKLRSWDRLLDHLDLVCNYICLGNREGPYFTRQARKTGWYGQSRLDKCYNNKRNDWCQYVKDGIQDGKQTLFDHILVTNMFILKEERETTLRRSSYFKMDSNLVNTKEIIFELGPWN